MASETRFEAVVSKAWSRNSNRYSSTFKSRAFSRLIHVSDPYEYIPKGDSLEVDNDISTCNRNEARSSAFGGTHLFWHWVNRVKVSIIIMKGEYRAVLTAFVFIFCVRRWSYSTTKQLLVGGGIARNILMPPARNELCIAKSLRRRRLGTVC